MVSNRYNPRHYPLPKECKRCDFKGKKDAEIVNGHKVTGEDFCKAFGLHMEYIPDILEGQSCYKAQFDGMT